MYLIIIGAGLVGAKLIQLAVKDNHNVVVVEEDENRASEISQQHDIVVIHADVARGGILDEAGIEKADALIATTADDSANLMALFMATEHSVKTLVSVVNDQKHTRLFERLGVHVLVDPEMIVAQHLYNVVCEPSLEDVVTLSAGGQVFEVTLKKGSPLAEKSLTQAMEEKILPQAARLLCLRRGEDCSIPSDETKFREGDRLAVFSLKPLKEEQLKVFTG